MANELDFFRGFPTDFRDLFGTSRRLNRLFDDFFERGPEMSRLESMGTLTPKFEVEDTDDHYVICAELPGVPKENISVETRGNTLRIFGEKGTEGRGKKEGRQEYRRYEQTLMLPDDAEWNRIEAEYRDGILYLAVPKSEGRKAKKIEIGRGQGLLEKIKNKVSGTIAGKTEKGKQEKAA